MTLERRTLGRTGLNASVMGLGSGGPSQLGQKRGATVESVRRLLDTAFEHGIDFIDTAPGYGSSEVLLGQALHGIPRERYVLSTKFNPFDAEKRLRPASDLRRSLEQSLARLGTDHVEVFYLHAVPAGTLDEVMDVFGDPLRDAVESGQARFTGVTEEYVDDHSHRTIRDALTDHDFDVIMVGYNLLSPSAGEVVLPLAAERNVGVVVMCAVRGVIADPDKLVAVIRNWKAQGLLEPDDLPDRGPLDWLLDDAPTITAAAYRFAAAPASVGCVLTGTASPEHLVENIASITGPPLGAQSLQRLSQVFGKVGRNVSPRDAGS
ncbi:MAG TPA: aldo/keto reductase [Acidimicrobiia bacterium]|nr:aldo/keto reductase [Acidimicrobiia bacterium]